MFYKKALSLMLSLITVLVLCSCSGDSKNKRTQIAVITKSTNSDFWENVFQGVNTAAAEYNVDVTITGPESEEDYVSQIEMIQKAIDNGSDAIVLSAIDYNRITKIVDRAVDKGIKVITIDSGLNSNKVSSFIGTDNYKAGELAAQTVINQLGTDNDIKIGIVNYDVETDNGYQREQGFRSFLKKFKNAEIVEAINVNSNTDSATSGAITLLYNHPEINVIVGFNEWLTLGVGYAVKQLGCKDAVYAVGFDSNTVSIGMLETGEMDSLIVQNPFAMGYLGIKSAVKAINGKKIEKSITTDSDVFTKENMFDTDKQKMLFKFQ